MADSSKPGAFQPPEPLNIQAGDAASGVGPIPAVYIYLNAVLLLCLATEFWYLCNYHHVTQEGSDIVVVFSDTAAHVPARYRGQGMHDAYQSIVVPFSVVVFCCGILFTIGNGILFFVRRNKRQRRS